MKSGCDSTAQTCPMFNEDNTASRPMLNEN